ncbi:G protein pathway suppressor 2 isoform X1 [Drosophila novamexicana]|uniref:G protein pathway suppressor 2 isoform X1 n=1 Tax=Drosophila novamexicana TaxID=47314 RepID=UPI0011E5E708|nr:G protein pathway suppressor 2 isoform X1 [Drosophila novamexicana]
MPPASAVNNNNAAVQAAAAERAEKLRGSLKGFILADRKRRQEEYERQCEELRLRREREARERENNLSLADTRSEISRLDEQVADLYNKKHQLVVQLKKVLNDDETRKKQAKENELFALQQVQAMQQAAAASAATAQVFLTSGRIHHQLPILQKQPPAPGTQAASVKRGRSPSPPSQQHQAYYKSPANYAQQQTKSTAQYPSTGTLFYQTTAAPPTTQHQAEARLQSIYNNYGLPLRPGYHVELQTGPSATVSKAPGSQSPSPKAQPMQVLHINLDQPPISQADLVQVQTAASSLTVQTSKPQVTMEKLPDRYHIEVKHEGSTQSHVPPPPHLLSEGGVIYKPMQSELSLHPNVLQISTSAAQNPKATGSITQGYAPGRAANNYDQQLTRQQLSMQPAAGSSAGQTSHGQQIQYTRRLY